MDSKKLDYSLFRLSLCLIILCLISAMFVLNDFYFISTSMQNAYYIIYIFLTCLGIILTYKYCNITFPAWILILIPFLLILIVYYNHIIAFPLVLIYPLWIHKNHKLIVKTISYMLYVILIFILFITSYIRMIATKNTLLYELTSPNKKYKIEVVSSDEGALGGITKVKLDNIYWNTFKKERIIYLDHLDKINIINWIDNNHININGTIIDINSKRIINKLKSSA